MGSVARVTSAAEGLPRRRFTVAEVEAMVAAGVMEEDERVELIGGELVPIRPKETNMRSSRAHWSTFGFDHGPTRLPRDAGNDVPSQRRHLS
jgi:hypothetical protein